jgi:hypothetical protein
MSSPNGCPFLIKRLGRRLLWGHPKLYRFFGLLRGRGDCVGSGFDIWIGGYPRSANSFATAALRLCNPGVRIATHWHIPTFIINAARANTPGMLLLRRPAEAVVSWTIFWEGRLRLEDALDYYIDFHRALLPFCSHLFVASFEEITGDFNDVLRRFNQRFGTFYLGLPKDEATANRCISYMEDWFRSPDGSVNELKVPRPSTKRAELKIGLTEDLQKSGKTSKALIKAEQIYERLHEVGYPPVCISSKSSHHAVQQPIPG